MTGQELELFLYCVDIYRTVLHSCPIYCRLVVRHRSDTDEVHDKLGEYSESLPRLQGEILGVKLTMDMFVH